MIMFTGTLHEKYLQLGTMLRIGEKRGKNRRAKRAKRLCMEGKDQPRPQGAFPKAREKCPVDEVGERPPP